MTDRAYFWLPIFVIAAIVGFALGVLIAYEWGNA